MARISACLISKLYQFLSLPLILIVEQSEKKQVNFMIKRRTNVFPSSEYHLPTKLVGFLKKVVVKIKSHKLFKEKIFSKSNWVDHKLYEKKSFWTWQKRSLINSNLF